MQKQSSRGVLRNFTQFTGKHLSKSLLFNKVAGLRPAALFKKRFWHRCFPVNFAKFLRTPFLQNFSGRLLLKLVRYLFHVKKTFLSILFWPCLCFSCYFQPEMKEKGLLLNLFSYNYQQRQSALFKSTLLLHNNTICKKYF